MKISQTNGMIFSYYSTEAETIKHMHEAGFKYVDISFFYRFVQGSKYWNDDYLNIAKEYVKAFHRYDVTPVQSHAPAANFVGDDNGDYAVRKTLRSMELAHAMGISSMTIHPGFPNSGTVSKDEFISRNVSSISRILPKAEAYGIDILMENIGSPMDLGRCHALAVADLCDLVKAFDHPLMNINYDVGHGFMCGNEPYEAIMTMGKRLHGVHIHDNHGFTLAGKPSNGGDEHILPFEGNIDYDAMMRGLIDVGYTGALNFEVDGMNKRSGDGPLSKPSAALRLEYDKLLYHIGQYFLASYGLNEE